MKMTLLIAIALLFGGSRYAMAKNVKLECQYMSYSCQSASSCDWEYPGTKYSLTVDVKPTGEPNHFMGYTFLPDHGPRSTDSVGVEIDQIRRGNSIEQSMEVNLIVNNQQVRATGEHKVETTFWNSITANETVWGRQLSCRTSD